MEAVRNGVSAVTQTNDNVNRTMDSARQEAATANATAARGVSVIDAQASEANATASHGVSVIDAQASEANATAAHGVSVIDAQASEANATAAHGVSVIDAQASEANATAAHGVSIIDAQASEANATASHGVSVIDAQASEANATASHGVSVIDAQASEANATAAHGVSVIDAQASEANATAAQGVSMLEDQASVLNNTAQATAEMIDGHLNNVTPVAQELMGDMTNLIENLADPLAVVATLIGPLQLLTGANIVLTILQTLNIIRGPTQMLHRTVKEIKVELEKLTDAVKGVRDELHACNVVNMARNITGGKTFLLEGNKIKSFVFYSSNISCISQLKGSNFCAFSSVNDMFRFIQEFSEVGKVAKIISRESLQKQIEVNLEVIFLDPDPEESITIPYYHFTGDNIDFISHSRNKRAVVFQCIFVDKSSRMHLEGVQVESCVSLGRAELKNCLVGHDPNDNIDAPPLEYPSFICVPFEMKSYSVGCITYNQCTSLSRKGNTGVFNKLSVRKEKKRNVTIFCREVCKASFEVGSCVDVGPGGHFEFAPVFKCWNTVTIKCGEIGPSASYSFSKGGAYPNLLFLCPDDYCADEALIKHCSTFDKRPKKNTILVVGRFGSGKSTLLNTLAGVHWKFNDGEFVPNEDAMRGMAVEEMFATSRSVKGCTVAAIARDIITFDGRKLTVIDTVGYDDAVNAESFYNTSNLSDVMDQYDEISAVVIVVNSKDPRLTQGFVESLACVPVSFKKEVIKNIVVLFTNWSKADEEEFSFEPYRGFDEQVKVIHTAMGSGFGPDGVNDDAPIPAFWVDNRPFKKCTDNARLTISNLSSFLDHVSSMPQLSCKGFKEMRALSQFERAIRKAIKQYFHPSKQNVDNPSGFELFLFECAQQHKESTRKVSLDGFTAESWAEKLITVLQQGIADQLPRDLQKICKEVTNTVTGVVLNRDSLPKLAKSVSGQFTEGLFYGSYMAITTTAVLSAGLSLCALPGCAIVAYGHSKTWSRDDVIRRIVFGISEQSGEELCLKITDQISSHVDELACKIQQCFASVKGQGDLARDVA